VSIIRVDTFDYSITGWAMSRCNSLILASRVANISELDCSKKVTVQNQSNFSGPVLVEHLKNGTTGS